ncbi:MAG: tetratricopeptide repeat protein [Myxococcales bacterium]|nr:tetratricopeptide repeat protein [Myxococcales bacterium]
MGLFSKRRVKKAVQRALASRSARVAVEASALDGLSDGEERADGWVQVAEALMEEGAEDDVVREALERATGASPSHWDAWALLAELEEQLDGRHEQAIAAYERLLAISPVADEARVELALLLLAHERVDEAREHIGALRRELTSEQGLELGRALFGAGALELAIDVLAPARERCLLELKQATFIDSFEALKSMHDELVRLHDEAYAEVHGREQVVVQSARAAQLDGGAPVNYSLLGESLMVDAPRIARELTLRTVRDEEQLADTLLAEGHRAHGLVMRGSAYLRQGRAGAAVREMRDACEADGSCFAAFLGLGAALACEHLDAESRVRQLEKVPPIEGIERVVVDYPVLTELERRVVDVSTYPLRACLPPLAEAGVTIRLLPADVRVVDVPELAPLAGERGDDHRTVDALGGVASLGARIAAARVLELLPIEAANGWTFGHELSHLAFYCLADEWHEEVVSLYERAVEAGYVVTAYAASNIDEFFAGTYEAYLRTRHHCHAQHELDDEGIVEQMFDLFDDLASAETEAEAEASG